MNLREIWCDDPFSNRRTDRWASKKNSKELSRSERALRIDHMAAKCVKCSIKYLMNAS